MAGWDDGGCCLSHSRSSAFRRSVRVNTYSLSKYASVIGQAGGWDWYQGLLRTLADVGKKHGVTIADVAARWVLDKPQVGPAAGYCCLRLLSTEQVGA